MITQRVFLSLVPAILAALTVVNAVPGDWDVFVDFITERRKWIKKGKDSNGEVKIERMLETRAQGTFWFAPEAAGLDLDRAVNNRPALEDDNKWPGECAVVFYFDNMKQRLSQVQNSLNGKGEKSGVDSFARPLAIAPLCKGKKVQDGFEIEGDKMPKPGDAGGRVVFHNYKNDVQDDVYFIMQNATLSHKSCLNMEDFQNGANQHAARDKDDKDDGGAHIREYWPTGTEGIPEFGDEMLKDWVVQYTKSREGEFCIPNPRLYGRGSKRWSDWNWLSTFWGYMDDGSWSDSYEKSQSIAWRKRSRIQGPV